MSQVLRSETDFTGGFASTLRSTNPRTETARSWSESSRTEHGTEPLMARAGPSLPGYSEIFPSGLTYRTQSLNLKSGRERGERETQIHGWRAATEPAQDPTHAHFSAPTSPRWGRRRGGKAPSSSSPSSLPPYLRSHTWSQRKRQMLNEITRAASRSPIA